MADTGSVADTVFLGGHRFWKIDCNYFGQKFCDRVTDVDMGDWGVNPTKVHSSKEPWQTFAPADIHYHDLTITAHVDPEADGALQKLLTDQATGANKSAYRFTLSVHLTDSVGADQIKYDFLNCMLTSVSNSPGDSHDTTNSLKEVLIVKPTTCSVP